MHYFLFVHQQHDFLWYQRDDSIFSSEQAGMSTARTSFVAAVISTFMAFDGEVKTYMQNVLLVDKLIDSLLNSH